jgi:hypothetical protein
LIAVACGGLLVLGPVNAARADRKDPPPSITYTISGIRGAADWYRGSSVVLRWAVSDPEAVIIFVSGCEKETIHGPDPGSTRTCQAWSENGFSSLTTKPIKIDAEPPTGVRATASRPPDHHGWYNHPLAVTWGGADATSGIADCTSWTYAGPDRAHRILKGRCVDRAGNRSSMASFVVRYDSTPPRLGRIAAKRSGRAVRLRWAASRDSRFVVTRSPGAGGTPTSVVYQGARRRFTDRTVKRGIRYRYTLTAVDRAGNTAAKTIRAKTIGATRRAPLLSPPPGARLRSPRSILFTWKRAPQASYYNIQLWRDGVKVVSAWPETARFRLAAPWVYGGLTRYLRAGRYTWYVWPAHGPRSKGAYGALLGSSSFVVTR